MSLPRTEDIDLSAIEFWERPLAERDEAFAALRALPEPPFFAELDMSEAGFPPGPGYYALVKHADVVEASRTPEIFRSGRGGATSIWDTPDEFNEFFGSMINMDDPRHARLRRIVSRAFTPRMIRKFEDDVQRTAEQVVAELIERGPCDFVTEVAAKVPLKIICDMMGIPAGDYTFVYDRSNIILGAGDPEYVPNAEEIATALLTAGGELAQLVTDLAAHRQQHPGADLITALATANIDGEQLTPAELGSFFILLVVAGNETTRNAISHGLDLLTRHPDQKRRWLEDFERYAPTAVEEIVRIASPVVWMRRNVDRDHEMNGHLYREGDKVLLMYWSANRDESVFADPYAFDIGRDPNHHVGFGGPGPHFCLGAHLARREITVTFRELLARLPDIEAAGEPRRLSSSFINGIKHLPCTFSR